MSGTKIKTLKIHIPDDVDVKTMKSLKAKFELILYLYDLEGEWV